MCEAKEIFVEKEEIDLSFLILNLIYFFNIKIKYF